MSTPTTLEARLLVANLLLFVPVGLLAVLGWRRPSLGLAAGVLLSIVIELAQFLVFSRVAVTDDVNGGGAALGALLGSLVLSLTKRLPESNAVLARSPGVTESPFSCPTWSNCRGLGALG